MSRTSNKQPIRIFTWHVHDSYLYYLAQSNCQFFLPATGDEREKYGKRFNNYMWNKNVFEVPASEIERQEFDCILFQSRKNFLEDQFQVLTKEQRMLPKLYLEHNPPGEHPTDTQHIVNDPSVVLVHVTHFNNLMWNCNRTPTVVIGHGVMTPKSVKWNGELERGVVMVNNIQLGGRQTGYDIFERIRKYVPLDLIGIGSEELGGLGEIPHHKLPAFLSKYRFFFNPIRYTSLRLSVIEAMMAGVPIVGFATTEMATAIKNGMTGFVDTDINQLVERMQELLASHSLAQRLGENAKNHAMQKYSIHRFTQAWEEVFDQVVQKRFVPALIDIQGRKEIRSTVFGSVA